MKKGAIIEILLTICVSYTIISLAGTIINMLAGFETNNLNVISMLFFTSIAVLVLNTHRLFDGYSPLFMIIVQYMIAIGLVMLYVAFVGIFSPVSEGGYWDIFVSFTIPYLIGAVIYYISIFREARRQDALLQEIKESGRKGED